MGPDWLDLLLRTLAVLGMAYGAYQGIQRMRADGTWSTAAFVLSTALLLAYVGGGIIIVLLYSLTLVREYLVTFFIVAALYFVGGFYLCWKLAAYIKVRIPPKGDGAKPGVGSPE